MWVVMLHILVHCTASQYIGDRLSIAFGVNHASVSKDGSLCDGFGQCQSLAVWVGSSFNFEYTLLYIPPTDHYTHTIIPKRS
jgi:hypothetical protein